ncbi:hypothetical protein D3C75_730240 [compost metagenome]
MKNLALDATLDVEIQTRFCHLVPPILKYLDHRDKVISTFLRLYQKLHQRHRQSTHLEFRTHQLRVLPSIECVHLTLIMRQTEIQVDFRIIMEQAYDLPYDARQLRVYSAQKPRCDQIMPLSSVRPLSLGRAYTPLHRSLIFLHHFDQATD